MGNIERILSKDEILNNFEELNKVYYPYDADKRNQLRSRMIKLLYDD